MYSTDNKEKSAFKRGFTLDGAGRATGLFPSGSRAGSQDPDAALKSMLTDSDAARLSEFCAVAPVPSGVREAAAANSAVFSLVSDRFSYGVAVKERIFGGTAAVFYLMEKGECPAGAPRA